MGDLNALDQVVLTKQLSLSRSPAAPSAWEKFRLAMPNVSTYLETKLSCFVELSSDDLAGLATLQDQPYRVARGKEIMGQGEPGRAAYVLQAGWGCSYKILRDGGRQIITFPIPGDMIGLRSILLRTSDHTFRALTDVVVSRFDAERLKKLIEDFPRLGNAIFWAASRDKAVTVEHLASIRRRSAIERTAHFFLELRDRLQLVGLASDAGCDCPLNQYVIADALGLSSIHVNRVLRQLRELNLLTLEDRRIVFHDTKGLVELAGYDAMENE